MSKYFGKDNWTKFMYCDYLHCSKNKFFFNHSFWTVDYPAAGETCLSQQTDGSCMSIYIPGTYVHLTTKHFDNDQFTVDLGLKELHLTINNCS